MKVSIFSSGCTTTNSLNRGFTFIELIIVFTITTILGTVGLASLASYNNSQQVVTVTSDLRNLFQIAQSRSASQVKPSQCTTDLTDPSANSTLIGYEVDFCAGGVLGKPAACQANDDYEVNAQCSNGVNYILISSKKYSSDVTITPNHRSFFFPVLTGDVDQSGTITVSGFGKTNTITISKLGVIQ